MRFEKNDKDVELTDTEICEWLAYFANAKSDNPRIKTYDTIYEITTDEEFKEIEQYLGRPLKEELDDYDYANMTFPQILDEILGDVQYYALRYRKEIIHEYEDWTRSVSIIWGDKMNLKDNQIKLVLDKCLQINKKSGKSLLFFRYSPHVVGYSVAYYKDGWSRDYSITKNFTCVTDMEEHSEVLNFLNKLLEN